MSCRRETHRNTPIYHEGYLYGSSGRYLNNAELRCIEWKTGRVMWSRPGLVKPPAWAAPILSHGLLYVRGDDRLVCLRLTAE